MTRITLTQFLTEQQRAGSDLPAQLRQLIEVMAQTCQAISSTINKGALVGVLGSQGSENVQGEVQKKLDVIANDLVLEANEWGGTLAALASEEMETLHPIPKQYPRGDYLLVYDPVDGSSNIDVNLSVGTIFSILKMPAHAEARAVTEKDFLQPGHKQVAAGYVVYGPQTTMMLTFGKGVVSFTLDRELGAWVLTQPNVTIPSGNREFAINMSNMRHWAPPIRSYIEDCLAGREGPRGHNYNMRWTASMVADVQRILNRGGIFLYPWDAREPNRAGKLRLMYEANPLGMIVEQAGGAATDGQARILDIEPTALHQRVGVVLGSREEVEAVREYFARAP